MIKGGKIMLRPAVPDDRRQIFEWLAHADTTSEMLGPPRFADNPVPAWEEFMDDYSLHFFDDQNPDNGRSYIIEAAGEPVGHINYNEIDRATDTVELDIWLAGSKCCNRGYGTDAINALCRHLADNHHCKAFILAPSARNSAAVNAYKKCGFNPVDILPAGFIPDYYDTVVMIKRAE